MDTKTRNLILAILGAMALIVGFLTVYFQDAGAPSPAPSGTPPSPSSLPSSVAPSSSSSPSSQPSASAPSPTAAVRYRTQDVVTLKPTFVGARVGAYPDVLIPDPVGPVVDDLPTPKGFPFYTEVEFSTIMGAFGIADDSTTMAQRGQIYAKVLSMLRSFGVEPIKHAVAGQPLDWDAFSQYGLSYRQVVLTNTVAPPCVAGPSNNFTTYPFSTAFLQKVEAGILSGEVPAGAWIYAWDEPTSGQMTDLVKQLQAIRAAAPHLKTMVTMRPSAQTAGLVDMYTPIFDSGVPGSMLYGSCTAAGTCSNGSVGTPTGTPMMALDADPVNWTAYPVVAAALGAKGALYYDSTLRASFATSLSAGGEYQFGNNGDGMLMYPGPGNTVLPSARLLGIKRGLAKVAAMSALGKPLTTLVQDAKHWSHNLGDYAP